MLPFDAPGVFGLDLELFDLLDQLYLLGGIGTLAGQVVNLVGIF